MAAYLSSQRFKQLTLAPAELVAAAEASEPGWLDAQLELGSSWIDSRLGKRYAVPFDSTSPPTVVEDWLQRLVTRRVYLKRDDVGPNDRQFEAVQADALAAEADIKEAADSEKGLFDLPLRANTTQSGISKGGPRVYSEASPYVGNDVQAARAQTEDSNGSGTTS